MLLFREFFNTQSDQNIHQNAPNFLEELAFAPDPPSINMQL